MPDSTWRPSTRCTDEHARFCSQCTTARQYNSIHCQDCGEGRPSAATTPASSGPCEAATDAAEVVTRDNADERNDLVGYVAAVVDYAERNAPSMRADTAAVMAVIVFQSGLRARFRNAWKVLVG